jgi:hypothetical protein
MIVMLMTVIMLIIAILVMHMSRFAMTGIQKFRLKRSDAVKIETLALQYGFKWDIGALRTMNGGKRVKFAQPLFDLNKVLFGDKISFVENNLVGERYLLYCFTAVVQTQADMARIDNGGH